MFSYKKLIIISSTIKSEPSSDVAAFEEPDLHTVTTVQRV